MIGIQFWIRVPYEEEPGQPSSAATVAKRLGVTAQQLQAAFEKWRQEGYPREHTSSIPDAAPAVLAIWLTSERDWGWVLRARTWGKGTRRTGEQVPFTMEVAL